MVVIVVAKVVLEITTTVAAAIAEYLECRRKLAKILEIMPQSFSYYDLLCSTLEIRLCNFKSNKLFGYEVRQQWGIPAGNLLDAEDIYDLGISTELPRSDPVLTILVVSEYKVLYRNNREPTKQRGFGSWR